MPLGLAYIAGYLREKGISVSVVDAEAEQLSFVELKKRLAEIKPDVVGITSMTPTVHDDLAIARVAKELGAKVVFGGPQVNAMPEETMQFDCVDFGIQGEGEYPMYKLVTALRNDSSMDDVPGLIYKGKDSKLIMKPPYIHDNLDELPMPARDLFPYQRYGSIISKGRLTTLCAGRGCPFKCGFCFKQPSDEKVRFRSTKLIVDEIEEIKNMYGIGEINFVSDTFTLRKRFIEELCWELIDRKINVSWIAPTRVDYVTPKLLELMKKAGCRSLRFGIESGSTKILKLMGKDIDNVRIFRVFKWAKKLKIETFAYFIVGYLSETKDTMRETLNFVKKLKPDLLMYSVATPLPGTKLFQQAIDAGVIDKDYWKRFLLDKDCERIPYLFDDTEKWISLAYREFFFSPRFLLKKLLEVRPENISHYWRATRGILGLKR